MAARLKVILDTDPGIDDAMAMAFLGACTDVSLLAVTAVFGNAGVATTTRNALYLRQRLGLDVQVYQGADQPLNGARGGGALHVHGGDALGGLGLTAGFSADPATLPAHLRMIELIHRHPGEISILAIGPLTNLALALRTDPSIAGEVREVVVMGGAFGRGPRQGNVTAFAEANVHNDPLAALEVFNAAWPIRAVGLDVTLTCCLTTAEANDLARDGGPTGQLLWSISRDYEALYRDHDGLPGCALHDVAAAVCLVAPHLFDYDVAAIDVVQDGVRRGQTVPNHSSSHGQQICREAQSDAVVKLYTRTLVEAYRATLDAG